MHGNGARNNSSNSTSLQYVLLIRLQEAIALDKRSMTLMTLIYSLRLILPTITFHNQLIMSEQRIIQLNWSYTQECL